MSELQARPPRIEVICGAPRRLKGEYSSGSFEELCKWIYRKFTRPKALGGYVLEALAKDGHFPRRITWYCDLEARSPHLDYPQYEKLAQEAGFLRRKRGQLELSPDFSNRESVLRFAKLIDEKGKLIDSIRP